jgi:hypothetical protein
LLLLGQSECVRASAAKSPPPSSSSLSDSICACASLLERVALERLDPAYISRM